MARFRRPLSARSGGNRPDNVVQFAPRERQSRLVDEPSWWRRNWAVAVLLAAPLVGLGAAWLWQAMPGQAVLPGAAPAEQAQGLPQDVAAQVAAADEQYEVSFERCGSLRTTCVVDGDTLWLEGTKIRIADINTPEVSNPECPAELDLGERATDRLIALLNEGGFSLRSVDRDEDVYGRKLRVLTRDGESLGATLVEEGLAEAWTGSRSSWC